MSATLELTEQLIAARIPLDIATQRLAMVVVIVLTIIGIRASGMPIRGPFLGALGYGFALAPMTAHLFEISTSTHYGRMVMVDDNTVVCFGNMDDALAYIEH